VDSGLGMDILKIVLGRDLGEKGGVNGTGVGAGNTNTNTNANAKGKEGVGVAKEEDDAMEVVGDGDAEMKNLKMMKGLGEDRRVIGAALGAVCNVLTDFSPLRPVSHFFLSFLQLSHCLAADILGRKIDATIDLHHEGIWRSFASIKRPLGCEKHIAQDEYGDEKGCNELFRMAPSH